MIRLRTLTDGGQEPVDVARELTAFIGESGTSLDLALYDIRLPGAIGDSVRHALEAAAARGVHVRLAYNVDHGREIPVPPPPRTDPEIVESIAVDTKAIPGVPDLMHHKYAIRDAQIVWTGSTNWTLDSWRREENVIVTVDSPALAAHYLEDFRQLWKTGRVEKSGRVPPNPVRVDGTRVRAWFSPGFGEELAEKLGHAIGRAKRRVRIASPVITSGPIVRALADTAEAGRVDLAGVVDATQVHEVFHQWARNDPPSWKIEALERALRAAPFTGKHSTPYSPGSIHDYMHAKIVVADDVLYVGSYNLSHSGEMNAENVLEIEHPGLAEEAAAYVDEVRSRYPVVGLPHQASTAGNSEEPSRQLLA
jgi:phosphatidylserine/phosphatidylglycerophosphate/cardiolipin synthase-like enzyme